MEKYFKILAFYEFIYIANQHKLADEIKYFCENNNIRGVIIIAPEGINLTVAGLPLSISSFENFIKSRNIKNYHDFIQSRPNYAIWDDHDYGRNNSIYDFELKDSKESKTIEAIMRANRENFCFVPLSNSAERIDMPTSSRLVSITLYLQKH